MSTKKDELVIDMLRKECRKQGLPPVVYMTHGKVYAERGHVVQSFRYWRPTVHTKVMALDAFPEIGLSGWRDATDEFIHVNEDLDGNVRVGVIRANGEIRYR